jgi:hypothetical protein
MLSLKNLEDLVQGGCAISRCDDESFEAYETMEGKVIPLCPVHYQTISSEVLW